MAVKRISRERKRDLEEPDRLTAFLHELFEFAVKYKVYLASGLGVVFVLIIATAATFYFTNKAEDKASLLLSHELNKYQSIAGKNGLERAYLDVLDDFNVMIHRYSGKQGGKFAELMFAHICHDSGKYDKAIALYNQSLQNFDDNPFLRKLILSSLAYSYLAQKDYTKAADYFEKIASSPVIGMQDVALFNLCGIYSAIGNDEGRLTALKKIISDHKDSIYLEVVKENLSGNL